MKIIGLAGIGLVGALAIAMASAQGRQATAASGAMATAAPAVEADGTMHVPAGYRTAYEYLGSWAVAAPQGPGLKEVHVVYASPGAIAAYRSAGHFPDGTVLVKEVYAAATNQMTTGTVSREDQLKGWFVMIRDGSGKHTGSLWGDGWGWSWFDAGNPKTTTSTDYNLNCKSCHVPAQSTDWIYVGGYPPLKSQ